MSLKICRGPYHREGKALPVTAFSLRKYPSGKISRHSWCIHCCLYRKHKNKQPNHGYLPVERVWWIFDELIRRVGHMEAARRINMSPTALRVIKTRGRKHVQKFTVTRAVLALRDARQKREFRHRDSISHGAYLRGRRERQPQQKEEQYDSRSAEEAWKKRWQTRRRNGEAS